jgi:proteic killer suppression protein
MARLSALSSIKNGPMRRKPEVKHPGLKEVFEKGKSAKVPQPLLHRLKRRLYALRTARTRDELRQQHGFDFHALKGTSPLRYTISVNGPWRITFEWEEDGANLIDLEQYH